MFRAMSIIFLLFTIMITSAIYSENVKRTDLLYNQERFSAYIINNISYLSKEDLSYIIGIPIEWNSKERAVLIDNMRIYAKIVIYKGQMLLGIKEILQPLGYQIKWDQTTRTITIIPPSNKEKEQKAKINIQKNKNDENKELNNEDKKEKNYQIPIIDSNNTGKNTEKDIDKRQGFQVVFIPRSAFNEEYKVTVSDLKESKIYKGMYNSQDGYKFVIISVSQQNLSNKVQLYTGKFVLFDNRNIKYEYIEGLSSYVLQILMPMGINFGTLVFEIPESAIPSKLILETYGSTPIVINLL